MFIMESTDVLSISNLIIIFSVIKLIITFIMDTHKVDVKHATRITKPIG